MQESFTRSHEINSKAYVCVPKASFITKSVMFEIYYIKSEQYQIKQTEILIVR